MMKKSVIFLNGPTCVGKTSIAKLLQAKLLPMPFSIDMMIDMMPESINNWHSEQVSQGFWWKTTTNSQGFKISHIQLGPYAERVCESLKDVALTLEQYWHLPKQRFLGFLLKLPSFIWLFSLFQ